MLCVRAWCLDRVLPTWLPRPRHNQRVKATSVAVGRPGPTTLPHLVAAQPKELNWYFALFVGHKIVSYVYQPFSSIWPNCDKNQSGPRSGDGRAQSVKSILYQKGTIRRVAKTAF